MAQPFTQTKAISGSSDDVNWAYRWKFFEILSYFNFVHFIEKDLMFSTDSWNLPIKFAVWFSNSVDLSPCRLWYNRFYAEFEGIWSLMYMNCWDSYVFLMEFEFSIHVCRDKALQALSLRSVCCWGWHQNWNNTDYRTLLTTFWTLAACRIQQTVHRINKEMTIFICLFFLSQAYTDQSMYFIG